jgi:hypothetical protein
MFNNQADLFGLGIAIHQQPGKEKSQFDFFHNITNEYSGFID